MPVMPHTPVYEYHAKCKHCEWAESWTTQRAAYSAATWHVFDKHARVWLEVVGLRPPKDPLPATLGARYTEWESQR